MIPPYKIPVSSKNGAPMGRPSTFDRESFVGNLHLRKVPFIDGDYDEGGAYWGGGKDTEALYCAFDDSGEQYAFVRAKSFYGAIRSFPKANFPYVINDLEELFIQSYLECALWASPTDENGDELDSNYQISDIEPQSLARMKEDCLDFIKKYHHLIRQTNQNKLIYDAYSQAGHDFFLTRNHHGCGFWDSDDFWSDEIGEKLSQAAQTYNEANLLPGDGKLYYE